MAVYILTHTRAEKFYRAANTTKDTEGSFLGREIVACPPPKSGEAHDVRGKILWSEIF